MYDTFHANIEEQDPVAAFHDARRHISYVHISENDRGVPGRGHVPWARTFAAIKESGYDGWLTIEAFGRGLPELAAATRCGGILPKARRPSTATASSTYATACPPPEECGGGAQSSAGSRSASAETMRFAGPSRARALL